MLVTGFMLLIFIIVTFSVMQKENDSYRFKVFMDAKRVANSIAENINTISQEGHGYYKYFSIPEKLYGYTSYGINLQGNFLEINWSDQNWATNLITSNVSIIHLEVGEDRTNCVINIGGLVVISDVCNQSDSACGSVQDCDPMDTDACPTCFTPSPVKIHQNSLSNCNYYGCSTSEWHIYQVIPDRDGDLKVTFRGTGTMLGDQKTDLMFYDYSNGGCSSPVIKFQIETQSAHIFSVEAGKTYVIALDVDSSSCAQSGSYWLKTELK